MTREQKMVIEHPKSMYNGSRLIVSITPATEDKQGCLTLKLQNQLGDWWDDENESVVNLSQIDIAKFIAVLRGYEEQIKFMCGDTAVRFVHTIEPTCGYGIHCVSDGVARHIILNTYEAIAIENVLSSAIYKVAFG